MESRPSFEKFHLGLIIHDCLSQILIPTLYLDMNEVLLYMN